VRGRQRRVRGELENNSRIQRTLLENCHSDSLEKVKLTLSQGKKKKGDEVDDGDDDDAV
jgi:hypothetical protein